MKIKEKEFKFGEIVNKLDLVIYDGDLTMSVALIEEEQFLALRKGIIAIFEIDLDLPFVGNFNDEAECEFGDISDAVLEATLELYPPASTAVDVAVDYESRVKWCKATLQQIDHAIEFW